MAFVASLRSVVSHDVCNKLRKINGKETMEEEKDINKKGTMSYKTFVKIFNESKELKFSQQQVWQFLVHLGLAIPINDKDKEPRILVPSLISNDNRATMIERANCTDDTLSLQYVFPWDHRSLHSFHDLVVTFTRLFFQDGKGGEIAQCFSQKIEKRTLGLVAGVYGKFKEPHKSKTMEFTLLQYDEATTENSLQSRQRLLRIKLKPESRSAVEVLRRLDRAFSEIYSHLERGLPCEKCEEQGEKGRMIALDKELLPDEYEDNCDFPYCHNLEPKLKDIFAGPRILRRHWQQILEMPCLQFTFLMKIFVQVSRRKQCHHLLRTSHSQHHRIGCW